MKSSILAAVFAATVSAQSVQSLYGQCGGSGYTGPTVCTAGSFCSTQAGGYYAQCTPGTASTTAKASSTTAKVTTTTTTAKPTTTAAPSSTKPTTSAKPTSSAAPAPASGKVKYAGVNIAGCDFGCDTSGTCSGGSVCPTTAGPTQMKHFVSDDGLNIFRLPVGWQYIQPTLGGTLSASFFSQYDTVMQACLATGSHCILDVHNYARWNGGIIGQGGPTNAQFANLWSQLAAKYATSSNVIFGLMNEPHDLDMTEWAASCQAAVTAIRAAGATSQMILLPGTGYTSAGGFETNSAPALSTVKDSDGTVSKLIYDIHRYYDSDGSGTSTTCVQNHISDSFTTLATYLRSNKRQAFLSETGGGNTASCEQYVCQALAYLNSNSDVYLGWTGWAAGSFDTSYALTETPNGSVDQPIVSQCIAGEF